MLRLFSVLSVSVACAGLFVQQAPPRWSVERQIKIGNEHDSDQILTTTGGIVTRGNGDMFLLQPQEGLVRVFSSTGRLVRTIGQRGQGPGEFRSPRRAGWKGDSLWVTDLAQRRITIFSPTGAYARTISISASLSSAFLAADGSIVGLAGESAERVARGVVQSLPILRISNGGGRIDTIRQIPVAGQIWKIARDNDAEAPVVYRDQPFGATPLWTMAADGKSIIIVNRQVSATTGEIVVTHVDLDGREISAWRLPHDASRVTPAQVQAIVRDEAILNHKAGIFRTVNEAEATSRKSLIIPDFHPAVDKFFAGRNGAVWLRRISPTGDPEWWIVTAPGRAIGVLTLPSTLQVHDADNVSLWASERDTLDVESITRFAIRRP